ncbi:MAG TPA: LacI family DNA-binding transcriptional regulator [Deinococcales bacterium]|nr:LacI family DNA-binding transcriptional regulator [Deinococcales bacterium]
MVTSPRSRSGGSKATIEDVARLAGVGTTTVSRVMNGSQLVAAPTREKVLDAVRKLGYVPNLSARRFRTGRTKTVSMFLPMPGTEFYTRLVDGIDTTLMAAGYDLALFPLLTPERLERYVSPGALPYQADAVLFASLDPVRLYPDGRVPVPADTPVVLVDMVSPLHASVTTDNRLGGALAAERMLLRPAPTHVIQVEEWTQTPFSSGVFGQRLTGFRDRLVEGGGTLRTEDIVLVEFSWGGGRVAMREILQKARPPINVFASCDLMAIGAIDEVTHAGLQVGTDVRVIGFDDIHWAAERELTTVRQPIEDMGRAAAEEVIRQIETGVRSRDALVLQPALKVRASG